MKKLCSKCKINKEIDDFYKMKSGKHGRKGECKSCSGLYQKKFREININRIRNYAKEYRLKYSEIFRERSRRWKKENPEKFKKWVENNPNYNRIYYIKNREILLKKAKDNYYKNK